RAHTRSTTFPYTTLFRSLAASHRGEQRVEQIGLKVAVGPGEPSPGPINAQQIFRGHLAALTIVIAHLAGIGTVLVDYNQNIQARSEEHTSELQSPDHLVC